MNNLVLESINRFSLLENSKNVTVALSGGADSVSLLYCLLDLKEKLGISVSAAHLNHCLRGEESLRDEKFVVTLCEKLNVPLSVERIDIKAKSQETGESIELAARKARYAFFSRIANGSLIATAHTADDSLETVLFNLSRGTALKGLCGIPPKRDIFIRPLILCTRAQVEEYCDKNSIEFVTDSTNLTDEYTRNKIRHKAVPVLKDINPSVASTVVRNGIVLSEEEQFLQSVTDKALKDSVIDQKINIKTLLSYHKAIVKRALKQFFALNYNYDLENQHIEQLLSLLQNGGRYSMPLDLLAVSKNGYLYFEEYKEIKPLEYKTEIVSVESEKINKKLLNSLIDCDKIVGEPIIRKRKEGDKIRLADRGVTKTLKKIFTEKKIPINERENLPVVADDEGVIWVYGVGVAERVKVQKNTKKIMLVKSEIIK